MVMWHYSLIELLVALINSFHLKYVYYWMVMTMIPLFSILRDFQVILGVMVSDVGDTEFAYSVPSFKKYNGAHQIYFLARHN